MKNYSINSKSVLCQNYLTHPLPRKLMLQGRIDLTRLSYTARTITCQIQCAEETEDIPQLLTIHELPDILLPASIYLTELPPLADSENCISLTRIAGTPNKFRLQIDTDTYTITEAEQELWSCEHTSASHTEGLQNIRERLQQMANILADSSEKAGSGCDSELHQQVHQIISDNFSEITTAYLANSAEKGKLKLGVGLGLTPSSDDFWLGVLAAANYLNDDFADCIRAHILANLDATNLISSHYLQLACHGYFSNLVLDTLTIPLTTPAESEQLDQALCKLLNYGHHSGADTLLGIYRGLRFLSEIAASS